MEVRTDKLWTLEICGEPRPQPRPAVVRSTGRVYYPDKSGKHKAWKKAIMGAARRGDRIDGPVQVVLRFRIKRPKGHYTKRGMPTAKSHNEKYPTAYDVDNLAKAVLDALVDRGDISDDRHVIALLVTKQWAAAPHVSDEGCSVTVHGSAAW